MNRRQGKKQRRNLADINVVPYIDVMLVLLVIFMITTPLLTQGVDVHLPQAATKTIQTEDQIPIIVTVDRKGNYYLNISATPTVPMTPDQIAVRVAAELQLAKQQNKQKQVYVKGDTDVDYGKVVTAMALLQQAGAGDIGLMTQPINQNG